MGTDVHVTAERWNVKEHSWEEVTTDFTLDGEACRFMEDRNYAVFGWLAGVRNYSDIPPLADNRGRPSGCVTAHAHEDNHDTTWFGIEELCGFDFDQPVEDRRITLQTGPNSWDGGCTAAPGGGKMTTYRELFGRFFLEGLAAMKAKGAERLIFSFDS